jgi:hypothetical protein
LRRTIYDEAARRRKTASSPPLPTAAKPRRKPRSALAAVADHFGVDPQRW